MGLVLLQVGVAYTMMGLSLYMTFRFATRLRAKEAVRTLCASSVPWQHL